MIIDVKTHIKQSIELHIENTLVQEVGVKNTLSQEFVVEQKQNSEIFVENAPTQKVDVEQDVILVPVYKDATVYEGDYEVTPKVDAQTMPTKGKVMEEDVTIKSIPFFDVSNMSGGTTVYIAKEI